MTREMVPEVKVLAALPKDPCSLPSTHAGSFTTLYLIPAPKEPIRSSGFSGCLHTGDINRDVQVKIILKVRNGVAHL